MDTATTQTAEPEIADTEAVETPAPAGAAPKTDAFDPNSIDPRIKDHYSKQYSDYDKHKSMSSEYEKVLRMPEFRTWFDGLGKPTAPPPEKKKFELSDSEYAEAFNNKEKFQEIVLRAAKHIAQEEYAPKIEQTTREIELGKRSNELQSVIGQYKDFMDLDRKGLIEPYIQKYGNISFEDAYWLAKRHTLGEEADKRARGIVEGKRRATVEKPGNVSGSRSSSVKVKNREEAMQIAAERFRAGQEIPDFDYE